MEENTQENLGEDTEEIEDNRPKKHKSISDIMEGKNVKDVLCERCKHIVAGEFEEVGKISTEIAGKKIFFLL